MSIRRGHWVCSPLPWLGSALGPASTSQPVFPAELGLPEVSVPRSRPSACVLAIWPLQGPGGTFGPETVLTPAGPTLLCPPHCAPALDIFRGCTRTVPVLLLLPLLPNGLTAPTRTLRLLAEDQALKGISGLYSWPSSPNLRLWAFSTTCWNPEEAQSPWPCLCKAHSAMTGGGGIHQSDHGAGGACCGNSG